MSEYEVLVFHILVAHPTSGIMCHSVVNERPALSLPARASHTEVLPGRCSIKDETFQNYLPSQSFL